MKNKLITAFLVLSVAFSGAAFITVINSPKVQSNCVTFIIDYQSLKDTPKTTQCIETAKKINALDVAKQAGTNLVGTAKYGSNIVCRVNGLPDNVHPIKSAKHKNYVEKCADMPAEFGYWAVLVKTPTKDWGWATVGIADLNLNPGDSLALVFSVDGKLAMPN